MRYLKNYYLFLEKKAYEFGCVMLEFDFDESKEIQKNIERTDIFEPENEQHGLETETHLTLLYGLHKEVTLEEVESILKGFDFRNLKIEITGIGAFENEDFDVLKFDVKRTKVLEDIHNALSKLPNSDKYPEYNPHITIAYLKKGNVGKYTDENYKKKIENFSHIIFSTPSGEKNRIEI